MASGTLKLIAELNLDGRREDFLKALELATPSGHSEARVLLIGDNTFTRPASATEALIIVLPPTNAIVTRLKWAAGDTAPPALKQADGWVGLTLDAANLPASVILNAASAHAAGNETVVRWI